MKKLLIAFFLCGVCFGSFAQISILPTAYFGGQRAAGMDVGILTQDSDTVAIRLQVSLMSNFSIALSEPFDTLTNESAIDTVPYAHVMDSLAPGNWYIRLHAVSLVTGDVDTTMAFQVIVTDSFITPTVSVGAVSPTSDGGFQPMNLNSGFDSATVKVWLSVGDSTLQNPFWVKTFSFVGNSAYTDTFFGWPNPVLFSYVYVIENSVGSDTSDIRVIQLSNVPAWLSTVDSATVTDVTATGFWHGVTGDTDRVVDYYISLSSTGPAIDSATQAVPHQNVPVTLSHTFTGLLDETNYWIWAKLSGFGLTARYLVTTLRTPIMFVLTSDTAYTSSLTEETIIVRCSSEVTVSVMQVLVSDNASMSTSYPSQTFTLSQGVVTQDVVVTQYLAGYPFIVGTTYYYVVQGINADGASSISPVYSFVFMPQSTFVDEAVLGDDEVLMRGSILEWRGEKEAQLLLYSMRGQLVLSKSIEPGETISLGDAVTPGLYGAQFLSYGKFIQKEVMIQ